MSAVPQPRADQAVETEAATDRETGVEPGRATEAGPERGTGPGAAPSAARRTATRVLAVALACGVIGASVVLLAAGKTWARGTVAFGQGTLPVHATGSQATALPGALALVGLAALVAVFAVRRIGRYVVSGLLTLSGLGVVVVVLARRAATGALNERAAAASGLTRATAGHTSTTGWPLVAVAGGVLLLLAGLLALRYGHAWPAMSSRYDRPGSRPSLRGRAAAAPAPIDPDRAEDLWKALDRGEDPTQAPG
ncbi:TIGR02234 family membrane protein [Streptomyces sp. NPDC088197]|uniref:TIGR02234 family membrane protein n=1 Tax=unclassified Streptomyces TaxID=2593676 RepID=UPI0036E447A0